MNNSQKISQQNPGEFIPYQATQPGANPSADLLIAKLLNWRRNVQCVQDQNIGNNGQANGKIDSYQSVQSDENPTFEQLKVKLVDWVELKELEKLK